MTEADQAHTAAEVAALRRSIETLASERHGRVFNTAGDGFMLEFASAADALAAADTLCRQEALPLRIGVHADQVFVTVNGDLLGHAVNIAARLQQLADPGTALISIDVRRTAHGPLAEKLKPKGLLRLDKMASTIEAFALVPSTGARQGKPREPLLAVLPFDNYSGDPDLLYFSDGISDEILEAVSRIPGLKVIGRNSAFQFRGERKAEAANTLHATHVLDGTVRLAGTRMRIHAQLTEALSGTLLWGEKYDCDVADAFTVQDSIAGQVAHALQQALPHHKRAAAKIDPAAYELYLRARPLVKELAEHEARRAEPLLQQSIARAPDFAPSWAALAMARSILLPRDSDATTSPAHDAALAAANRALALDPDCADALVALAALKPAFADHGEKLQLTENAVALAPNDPLIAAACDGALISVGRVRDAMKHLEAAARLDPLSPMFVSSYAFHLRTIGRVDEALAKIDEAMAHFPDSPWVWARRWTLLFMSDRRDEAESMCAETAPLPAGMTTKETAVLRLAHMVFAMPKAQREQALRALLNREEGLVLQYCAFAAEADCTDLAYEAVFKALDTGRPFSGQAYGGRGMSHAFRLSTLFSFMGAAMRRDPRFATLCARVGLADYWCESQNWPDCVDEVKPIYDFRAACEKAASRA
jgi:TolB-like protein/Flp pilus assembly protein TadD